MTLTQTKKLKLNTITSLLYQIFSVASGFILPRLLLQYYGSSINGVVSSVTQFLSIISLCECGVGAVVQAALYKPLAENDISSISKIYVSSNRFFRRVAYILIAYIVVLIGVFPFINGGGYDFWFTTTLIISISIGTLAQYYLGITYLLMMNAAQLIYIQMTVRIVSVVVNVAASVLLVTNGASIQAVKLVSSIIFLVQPTYYAYVIKKHYKIDKKITYTEEPIKQKWNGMAQHIATVVFENTSVMILTMMSTLENVSVYGVYHMVTNGLKLFFVSLTTGIKSYLGDLYARNEKKMLDNAFESFEWLLHTGATLVFTVAGILVIPFVSVYTNGITDAEYIQPVFAFFMCLSMAIYTIRLVYNHMILSAGHFKQTQASAITEAVLNIVISVVCVKLYGLTGVSIAATVAMIYRTVYFVWYLSRNILMRSCSKFVKHIAVDVVSCVVMVLATSRISLGEVSYISWAILACEVFVICSVVTIAVNFVFYRDMVKGIVKGIKKD